MDNAVTLTFGRVPATQRMAIERAIGTVPCPFAAGVSFDLWRAQPGPKGGKNAFIAASGQVATSGTQAVLLEIVSEGAGNIEALADFAANVLDQVGGVQVAPKATADNWWLRIGGKVFFTTLHSPLYELSHTRHWPLPTPALIMIPSKTMEHRLPPPVDHAVRDRVRETFATAGKRYPLFGGVVASIECESRQ